MLNYIIAIKIIESRERYRIFFGIKQKERKEKKNENEWNFWYACMLITKLIALMSFLANIQALAPFAITVHNAYRLITNYKLKTILSNMKTIL